MTLTAEQSAKLQDLYDAQRREYHDRIEQRKAELGMMNRKQRRAIEAKAKKFEKIYKKK